jgi:nitrogen fixation protein FixH
VLLCTGFLSAFSSTLQPVANANLPLVQPTPTFPARPLTVTVITADGQLQATFNLAPNQVGINTIITTVLDSKGTPLPTSGISVSLAMTLTNLNNGTQTLNLPPDGRGHFKARTNLSTSGEWRILLTIHMPDGKTHEATVEFFLS